MSETANNDGGTENKQTTDKTPIKLYSELLPIIERLFEAAKDGNVGAAGTLIEGARIMALSVESLFNANPESRKIVRQIASETLLWPTVACPINNEHGPDWTREYLENLKLGEAVNLTRRKRDERTTQEERIAAVYLIRLAEQNGFHITRGGMKSLREWKKSDLGKTAKRGIKTGLEMLYGDAWFESETLSPIVNRARKKVEEEYRRRNGLERNAPAIATDQATKTTFFSEALSIIHGTVGD